MKTTKQDLTLAISSNFLTKVTVISYIIDKKTFSKIISTTNQHIRKLYRKSHILIIVTWNISAEWFSTSKTLFC